MNLTYQWPVYAFTKGKLYGKFAHIMMLSCKNKLFCDEYRASDDCNYAFMTSVSTASPFTQKYRGIYHLLVKNKLSLICDNRIMH